MPLSWSFKQEIRNSCWIALGVISTTIGLKGFLVPNHFADGGGMGIALLLNLLTGIDVSLLIFIVNLPSVFLAYKRLSLQFAVRSTISITLLSLFVYFVQIPAFTDDKLLIAIFGGFFIGLGIGLSVRGNSVIDGTEILAIHLSRHGLITEGNFIAIFNAIIFLAAAFLIGIETAMYSMLAYLAASKTVDFIVNGIEEDIGVTIISPKYKEIREMINVDLKHGVTLYKSDGGYHNPDGTPRNILYVVITRFEINKLMREIDLIDTKAFIIQNKLRDVHGGRFKKKHERKNRRKKG